MAIKDVTRFLHQPKKHYAAVRLQQGRPLLDSDFNEGTRLEEDDRKQTLVQLFGPSASPDQGFTIGRPLVQTFGGSLLSVKLRPGNTLPVRNVVLGGESINVHPVSIRPGSFYLGGMRFELGQPEFFMFQRGFLQMRASDVPSVEASPSPSPFSPSSPGSPQFPPFHNFFYLNAWEQVVTGVEDDEFTERALAGPDTTVRVRRMRRVEVLPLPDGAADSCGEAWELAVQRLEGDNAVLDRDTNELRSKGRLNLAFETIPTGECEPCTPDPGQKYLGSENQTLRIMLTGPNTFVWALDNAAPLYRVRVTGLSQEDPSEVTVKLLTPPRDDEHEPRRHRVVEILPFAALIEDGEGERKNDPHFLKVAAEVGAFTRVADDYDDETQSFTIDTEVGIAALKELVHRWDRSHPAAAQLNYREKGTDARFFYARFWHVADRADDVELPTLNNPNVEGLGETGVVPLFRQAGRRGDFWVATLRTDARERILPFDLQSEPEGVPPHGPRHYYAPLTLVDGDNMTVTRVEDCRPALRPITDRGCATYTVGDGLLSRGDFDNILDAVEALPAEGGLVSLLPGTHHLPGDGVQFVLKDRTGIVIEGCGDSTLLETTQIGPAGPLFVFDGCSNVTLSNFRMHIGEQSGISLLNCTNVSLNRLNLIAGILQQQGPLEVFLEVLGVMNDPLVTAGSCSQLSLRELTLSTQRRPGIRIDSSTDCALAELHCAGSPGDESGSQPAIEAMIRFETVENASIRQSTIETFAQVGIFLVGSGVRNVELKGLTLGASSFAASSGTDIPSRSAVDIDDCVNVSLERSHIVMNAFGDPSIDAAVVLRGRDITLDANHIECLESNAWGGVHIRGGSERVEVHENRIIGGVGHGITLGSVIWVNEELNSQSEHDRVRLGAGARMFPEGVVEGRFPGFGGIDDIDSSDDWPEDEGPIDDVRLADNRVEGLGSNGISALTVLGLRRVNVGNPAGPGVTFGEIEPMAVTRLVIARNSIIGNILIPTADRDLLLDSPRPGFDGDDVLPDGGYPPLTVLPQGGIVLALADGVEIRENTVVSNGSDTQTPVTGIFVLAGDGIVISHNRVTDNGAPVTDDQAADDGVRAGVAVILAGSTTPDNPTPTLTELDGLIESPSDSLGLDRAGSALQVVNNTVRQPEGRALHAVALGPVVIDGNFLASRGHHHQEGNAGFGDVVFVLNLSGPIEALNYPYFFGDSQNPFTTPDGAEGYVQSSFFTSTPGVSINGVGGQLLFSNNQVTYDWHLQVDESSSFCAVALLTRDHLMLSSNQFALRIDPQGGNEPGSADEGMFDEPVGVHVFAVGGTLNATRNRFSEEVGGAFSSLFAMGRVQNITAYNQSTHTIAVDVWEPDDEQPSSPRQLLDVGNQVMFPRSDAVDVPSTVAVSLNDFFAFVWAPRELTT